MGTWQHKEFEKCLTKVTYTNKIQQFDFKESGKYPIISQNAEFISGYWDDDKDVFKLSKPVVIFGDHTRCLKYIDFDFVLGADGVKILQTIDEILPKYLYYYLQYIPIDNLGYSRHYKLLKEKIIKYPTIEQQQKIVSILDKADEIRAKKRLANEKLDEFLKSTFIDMFGTLSRNEKQFPVKQLQDIAIKITDGSHFSPKTVETSNYPYVTVKDICNDRIDFDNCKFISKEDYEELVKNGCKPELNDVLFSKDGTVGKVSLVDCSREFVVLSSLAIIRPDIKIVKPQYLKWALKNPEFLQNAINEKTGVAIRRIILKTLKALAIILPPIEEQNKFAQIVEKVEAQKQKNEQVIEQMDNLFNSLSQRAFKGEL